jgi:hypothetical protein
MFKINGAWMDILCSYPVYTANVTYKRLIFWQQGTIILGGIIPALKIIIRN